jgi:hypothetical protein
MTPPTDRDMLDVLARLRELSPGVRFGQLLANLGFLTEDQTNHTLWDIEDEELLTVMQAHAADLANRQAHVA